MNGSEHLAAERHLDTAVRHLETAAVLIGGLAGAGKIGPGERTEFNALASDLGVLLDGLARSITGEDLEDEFARLLADASE